MDLPIVKSTGEPCEGDCEFCSLGSDEISDDSKCPTFDFIGGDQ